jgi:glycine betaine/proline transport system permease protein
MTAAVAAPPRLEPRFSEAWLWLGLFAATWALSVWGKDLTAALGAPWASRLPQGWRLPAADLIGDALDWLMRRADFGLFTFKDLTRAIAAAVALPYDAARAVLADGAALGSARLPPLSWVAVTAGAAALGLYAGGARLAAVAGGCFLYLALFGRWESAMVTLASVAIAAPLGVAIGLAAGIAAWRRAAVDRALRPALDLMQTVPVFAYLVPILILFGFGPVAALVATVIYAAPPMARITTLALRAVPEELREFARMAGCTEGQALWRVLLPSALPALMVGVNQVIMLTLNMVIIASMIGAGGLGFDVLAALRRLDIGAGLEAGLAITALAIALDRTSQALARRAGGGARAGGRRLALGVAALALASGVGGLWAPWLQSWPEAWTVTTAPFWSALVEAVNVRFFDTFEAAKTFMLTSFLVPVKRFLLGVPWPWMLMVVALIGWRAGGPRVGALCLALAGFVAAVGLWEDAMTTVYLCGVSVLIATLVGTPLGVWAALDETAGRVIGVVIDTLQTLPSFVYLIPVVMLFRVGDFSAMIAVVLYALAPAVRYAAMGVRSVDPQIVEAGTVAGCTPWQLLTRVRLPLAAPALLLGLNQTVMLALSMLVITALVGTRDLGQEVYVALTKADAGRGVTAGLCVASIAIIADRCLSAAAQASQARLGLSAARA